MPRIELIPEVYYQPNDPIHWEYDNLPLKNIITRQNLINLSLDDVLEQMRDAIGTQGSVANRLNQSINSDGSLKATAIDDALHSIEEHADGTTYVRMTRAQSDKLDLVTDEATDVVVQVNSDGSAMITFDTGSVIFDVSDSVTPSVTAPNRVKFNLAFPAAAAHQHYYGLTPVHANLVTPDYTNYKVNSGASAFVEGSLRIFVNGIRIFETDEVYVPGSLVDDPWTLLSFTPNYANGTFALSSAITTDDIIRIDFDISYL